MREESPQLIERLRRENEILRRENARLSMYEALAHRDELTGLYNRRYFNERLPQELSRSRREGLPLAVIIIDLKDFKRINDVAGHAAGDRALRWVGALLTRSLRAFDTACRVGGDEFALIVPTAGRDGARSIIDRIQRTVVKERATVMLLKGLEIQLSLGAAIYPEDAATADELTKIADRAMYAHKRNRPRGSTSLDIQTNAGRSDALATPRLAASSAIG